MTPDFVEGIGVGVMFCVALHAACDAIVRWAIRRDATRRGGKHGNHE